MSIKRSFARPLAAFALLSSFAFYSSARAQDLVISLTDPATLAGQAIGDSEILRVAPGGPAMPFINLQTLALYFGDRNGDGTLDVPNDIDALDFYNGGTGPVMNGMFFSLLADQSGFKDGDILLFDAAGPGSVSVIVSEAFLMQALDAQDGNIDVDALAIASDGTIYFSLAEDELLGPNQVLLPDDDMVMLAPGASKATLALPGSAFEAAASHALGKNVAIGDLRGLEIDGADFLFLVQSPSTDDATVFSTKNGGMVYAGFSESVLGFAENVEADALAFAPTQTFPVVASNPTKPVAGAMTTLSIRGLTPSQPFAILAAQTLVQGGIATLLPGFGALALDPTDSLFLASVSNLPALVGVASATGDGSFMAPAPGAPGTPLDVAVQAYDLAAGKISNPIVVEINQ